MMKNQNQQPQLETKSSELYIDSGGTEGFCSSLVYEPANISEFQIGSLYVAGEVKTLSKNCSYLINTLGSIIKKELYRNSKRSAPDSFESSLNKANAYLGDIASQGNIDWIGKIHMACALFSQGQLHIAHTGNARILLLRNGRITGITEDFSKSEDAPFPSKTFTNITSGPALNGDKIVLATSGLFNMLSLEELKHAISAKSCVKSIENLGEISEADDSAETSSVIVVDILYANLAQADSSQNLDELSTIEEYSSQAQIQVGASPSAKLSLKNILGESAETLSSHKNSPAPIHQVSKPSAREKALKNTAEKILKFLSLASKKILELLFRYSQKIIKLTLAFFKTAFQKIYRLIKISWQKLQNRISEKKINISPDSEFSKNLEILAGISPENIQENKMIIKINRHDEIDKDKKRKKIISISFERIVKFSIPALVIAIGFFGTFFLKKKDAPSSDNIPAKVNSIVYQGYLQKAQQNQQDAETALIYKDEKKAQELLTEASDLIGKSIQLGAASSEVNQIQNDIQAQLDHINRVTTIQNPFLICDIGKSFENFSASEISFMDNILQIIDVKNSQIADIDAASYKAKNLSGISLPAYASGAADSDSYGGFSYFLSKPQNQIFKDISGQPKPWIKQTGIDLSAAVSMSIDGNVYVLNSDGNVLKFTSGKLKGNLSIPANFKSPSKIYTRSEIDKLIILDPPAKTIIIASKSGELILQLKSDKFNDLKDACVDASASGMYVLNGNEVFRVDL